MTEGPGRSAPDDEPVIGLNLFTPGQPGPADSAEPPEPAGADVAPGTETVSEDGRAPEGPAAEAWEPQPPPASRSLPSGRLVGTPGTRAPLSRRDLSPPGGPYRYADEDEEYAEDDEYPEDEAYEGEAGFAGVEDDYYIGAYYGTEPTRQPLFYAFLGLAVVVGGLFVVLVVALARGDGNDTATGPDPTRGPAVELRVDAPANNERVEVGQEIEVLVRATATEAITRFELLRGKELVDKLNAGAPDASGVYSATLRVRFADKGDYTLTVRVVTESGGFRESLPVRVVAHERVTAEPKAILGRAITLATLRVGPADTYPSAGQLEPGREVNIKGKTRDGEWLLIDVAGGSWVRRAAIQEQDSLALVPVRDPTPTPVPPTRTAVPSPTGTTTPSVTTSPTVPANAPDLIPANALLVDAGSRLRVTVANLSPNRFEGILEVAVEDVGPGTLRLAFQVNIPGNGSAPVDFPLDPPVTTAKSAKVTVDPGNAVKESNEDNNRASFSVAPPVLDPDLVIVSAVVGGGAVTVKLRNDGGALAPTNVTVAVTVGSTTISRTQTLALANGQESNPIAVSPLPGSGSGTVEVFLGSQLADSKPIEIP